MSYRRESCGLRSACLLAAAITLWVWGATAARAAGGYPTDADTIVVQYRETLGEIAESDAGPSLTVYGDGRAVAHWPAYMTRGGDYHLRLSRAELDGLVASLVARGILDVDTIAVRGAVRAAAAAQRAAGTTLTVTSDESVTTIELHTHRGRRAVSWAGLRHAAREHPDIAAIQNLNAARQELEGMMDRAYGAPK